MLIISRVLNQPHYVDPRIWDWHTGPESKSSTLYPNCLWLIKLLPTTSFQQAGLAMVGKIVYQPMLPTSLQGKTNARWNKKNGTDYCAGRPQKYYRLRVLKNGALHKLEETNKDNN